MDLKGSLVNTYIRIYPSQTLIKFLKTISSDKVPHNFNEIIKDSKKCKTYSSEMKPVHFSSSDIENIKKIKEASTTNSKETDESKTVLENDSKIVDQSNHEKDSGKTKTEKEESENLEDVFLVTADIDWLHEYLKSRKSKGDKDIPYIHTLLEGACIKMPENETIKRNPDLEARCVKLRAQQEAREYRKMTKGVDNVRMKFPEDSISYQLKQLNRQLIAIGQFIISIFAGFLFGFKGVEWMIGNLDFGFRLLLGVMCALVIALAEIYFLAKKLNEELNIPETVQLGGPLKFADQKSFTSDTTKKALEKQHQD